MTRPVALPLRGNTLIIVNGDLATIEAQCAALPVKVSAPSGWRGIHVHIDHDTITTAQRVREATGTTLPTPEKRANMPSMPNETQIVTKIASTPLNGANSGISKITLRQLPPLLPESVEVMDWSGIKFAYMGRVFDGETGGRICGRALAHRKRQIEKERRCDWEILFALPGGVCIVGSYRAAAA